MAVCREHGHPVWLVVVGLQPPARRRLQQWGSLLGTHRTLGSPGVIEAGAERVPPAGLRLHSEAPHRRKVCQEVDRLHHGQATRQQCPGRDEFRIDILALEVPAFE